MRSCLKYFVVALALIVLSSPAWARKDEYTLDLDHAVTIGGTQIPAGEYQLKADEDKDSLTVVRNGKVVVDAKGQWVKLPKKLDDTQLLFNANRLVEVDFGGSDQGFHLN